MSHRRKKIVLVSLLGIVCLVVASLTLGARSLTITTWSTGDSLNATNLNAKMDQIEVWAALLDADYDSQGSNGQRFQVKQLTELTSIAAAASTDTAIQIPAGAVVFGVSVYTHTTIPTATTYLVMATTTGEVFCLEDISTTGGTSDAGTRNAPYHNISAQTIRIQPNVTPATATGKVRVTIHYYTVTPATS